MSKLETIDKEILYRGNCCDCLGELLEGPSGGANINMICSYCGSRFNVCPGMIAERISIKSPNLKKKIEEIPDPIDSRFDILDIRKEND